MHHEVVEVGVGLADGVGEHELDVDEVLVAGEELPGRRTGSVEPDAGVVPGGDLAERADRDAVDAVDAPREPDPESGLRPGDDPAEPADDGALLRPHLGEPGEQVRGERDQQQVAGLHKEKGKREKEKANSAPAAGPSSCFAFFLLTFYFPDGAGGPRNTSNSGCFVDSSSTSRVSASMAWNDRSFSRKT